MHRRVLHKLEAVPVDPAWEPAEGVLSERFFGGTMAVDERARHELRMRLEEILGTDEATTLMHYLPLMNWSEFAMKRDLEQLYDRLRVEIHREAGALRRELHQEIGALRTDMGAQGRNLFFGVLASNATLVGLVFAAVKVA